MSNRRARCIVPGLAVGLALGLAGAAPVRAELSDDLRRVFDLRIDGDGAGRVVAAAGDVDGDGTGDVIVGVPDVIPPYGPGSAYVVFGGYGTDVDLADPGARGFRVTGASVDDFAGAHVAGIGDVNGDGFDDVLIGAPGAGNNGRNSSGSVYVVFGGSTDDVDLADLGARGFRVAGASAYDQAGTSVAGIGDVNGDGVADMLIGALGAGNNGRGGSGSVYVVFGGSTDDVDLADLGARGFRVAGASAYDQAGASVAGIGDVNGDGVADMIIGAAGADNNGRNNSGSAYVVFGGSTEDVDLADLGRRGLRIDGAAKGDSSGAAVAGVGDVDGDGVADMLVGAARADNNGRNRSGSAYVVFGGSSGDVDLADLGRRGLRIDGAAKQDRIGAAVAGAGDVDGDGFDDVLIGAPLADNNGRNNSGSTYIVFGGSAVDVDLSRLGDRGFRIDGDAAADASGTAVAGAGDVDGDGFDEVLIGAPGAWPTSPSDRVWGSVYMLRGGPPATLRVTARKATRKIARTGRTTLVRRIAVGGGQKAGVSVRVRPKKARASFTVSKTRRRVVVRTERTPRTATVQVRIASRGEGRLTRTWERTWRMVGAPRPSATKHAPVLLALGDSWAGGQWDRDWVGYVNRLHDDLRSQELCRSTKGSATDCAALEVRNLATGGTTADLIRHRLSDAVELLQQRNAGDNPADDVVVTVLTIGGLDVFEQSLRACAGGVTDGCRLTVGELLTTTEANLGVILEALRRAAGPTAPIVITTYDNPIPHCYVGALGLGPTGALVLEGDARLGVPAGLNDIIRRVAATHGVVVAETFGRLRAADWVGGDDCLHPVDSGHEKIARAVLRALGLKATGPGRVRMRSKRVAGGQVRFVWREARRAKRYAVRISRPGGKTVRKWTVQSKRSYVPAVGKNTRYRIQVRGIGPGGPGPITTMSFRG